jgi:hypothetical protein
MRKFVAVLVSTLIPFSLLATQTAFAQDADGDAAAQPQAVLPPPPPGAILVPVQEAPPFKQYVIELNPLATFIGRYSIQGEYLPAVHHAITLNPFYTHASITISNGNADGSDLNAGSLSGFGGELGYRYYTGVKGPNGFYVGPSFLFSSYSQSLDGQSSDSFTSVGGAIDIGGQGVVGPGIVVGGGFGLQWTKTSKDIDTNNLNLASAVIAGGGTRPRFLFTIGYAF